MKDYYSILGVRRDATQDEIKTAYREKAMEYHPDHYGEDAGPFLAVQEAFTVLDDPERRRVYNRSLPRSRPSEGRPEPLRARSAPIEPLIPGRSARTFGRPPVRSARAGRPPVEDIGAGRIETLAMEIPLAREDALRGTEVELMIPCRAACSSCRGRGAAGPFLCPGCRGQGVIEGETPLPISLPPGVPDGFTLEVPLDRFGFRNARLLCRFRMRGL